MKKRVENNEGFMMKIAKFLSLIVLSFAFLACGEDIEKTAKDDGLSSENKDYLIACEKYDNIGACNVLARRYEDGEDAVKNEDKALKYYEKSCWLKADKFRSSSDDEFLKIIENLSEHYGSIYPCYKAGSLYKKKAKKGIDSKANFNKALKLHEQGCIHDDNSMIDYSCRDAYDFYKQKGELGKAFEFYVRNCVRDYNRCYPVSYLRWQPVY